VSLSEVLGLELLASEGAEGKADVELLGVDVALELVAPALSLHL
jgi:hypothetical protein